MLGKIKYRTGAHDRGVNARERTGDNGRQRRDAKLLGLLLAHNDEGSSSVVDGGGVTGGHDAVGLEGGTKLRERLNRRSLTRTLIRVEDDLLLALLDGDRNDLVLEGTVGYGLAGAVLRCGGKLVKLLAAKTPLQDRRAHV